MSARAIWIIFAIAAFAAAVLISNLFQPSGLTIPYDAQSYFEVRKLFFAAGVLAVLALLLMLSIAIYGGMGRDNPPNTAGKDIFDSMIKVVPPIITLVLGYYFGQQSAVRNVEKPAQTASQASTEGKAAPTDTTAAAEKERKQGSPDAKSQQKTVPTPPIQAPPSPASPASPAGK